MEGGGRLLGEGVHFFDMLRFLAGADPVRVRSVSPAGKERDEAIVAIEFGNGSIGTVIYAGGGASSLGKERIEVFAGGASFVLDDFRSLEVHGLKKDGLKTRVVEKGQKEQLENFHRALRGEASPRGDGRGRAHGHVVRGDGDRDGGGNEMSRGGRPLLAREDGEVPAPGAGEPLESPA